MNQLINFNNTKSPLDAIPDIGGINTYQGALVLSRQELTQALKDGQHQAEAVQQLVSLKQLANQLPNITSIISKSTLNHRLACAMSVLVKMLEKLDMPLAGSGAKALELLIKFDGNSATIIPNAKITTGIIEDLRIELLFMDMKGCAKWLITDHQLITFPIDLLHPKAKKGYSVYSHMIDPMADNDHENAGQGIASPSAKVYFGITKQGVYRRMTQHIAQAKGNSHKYLFQQAIAGVLNLEECVLFKTDVMHHGLSFGEAMDIEEKYVDEMSLYPRGLNAIPGGFAGYAYMGQKVNVRGAQEFVERRDEYYDRLPRTNPLLAQHWNDVSYAERVMCGHSNRLDASVVRAIQSYAEFGYSWGKTCGLLAIPEESEQHKRVFDGKTYTRLVA